MIVKIKKLHPNAVIPSYAKPGDAGMDLTAVSIEVDANMQNVIYKTGLAMEIPEGYVGLLFPRSSIYKTVLSLANSVGVIDSGYRGEIMFRFTDEFLNGEEIVDRIAQFPEEFYQIGDRVGQILIIPYPEVIFHEVSELSKTERGEGGFGSSNIEGYAGL